MIHAQPTSDHLLSESESLELVQTQRAEQETNYQASRAALEAVPALDERSVNYGGHRVIVRRVSEVGMPVPQTSPAPAPEHTQASPVDLVLLAQSAPVMEQLYLSITSYGDSHARIDWRDENHPQIVWTAWTNLSLRYASGLGSFNDESYHYFLACLPGIVTVDSVTEAKRQQAAAELGIEYQSRWQEPPVSLSDDVYEYLVITDDAATVPDKLYRQLDGLLGTYLERRDELEIRHKNNAMIHAARVKDRLQNPVKPKDSVTNYWPGKNSAYLDKQN